MSWLARSLADSLRLDDDGGAENDVVPNNNDKAPISPTTDTKPQEDDNGRSGIESADEEQDDAQTRGVKDDLDEFKQTLTRQFWGVATFLAPPPSDPSTLSNRSCPDFVRSEPPDNRPEQLAMDLIEDEEDALEECAVGVTEEVLAFAKNIAMHPETWLDFPLDEEEDLGDFEMSDTQQEHALAIEHFAPRLAALRFELCPCHMSESYFWKVYFVLLHSRLNKQDAEILSTPQVMEARAKWMQELQCQTMSEYEGFGRNTSFLKDNSNIPNDDFVPVSSCSVYYEDKLLRTHPYESTLSSTVHETEKHPVESDEMQFIDKSVIEENPIIKTEDKNLTVGPSSKMPDNIYEDDEDDWPEEDSDLDGYSGTALHVVNEEDISFSDLEDDDFLTPTKLKIVSKE
ncbi:hypothetical protein ACE6H2_004251 [Prunus campanulata]